MFLSLLTGCFSWEKTALNFHKLFNSHTQTHTVNLQMEEHDGDQRPLWSFVDDVGVGEPAVVREQNDQRVSHNLNILSMCCK